MLFKLKPGVFILSFFIIFIGANAQTKTGKLTIKVKAVKEYEGLWDSIIIENKDTSFRLFRLNAITPVTIPQGEYKVILKSRINGKIIKDINLKKVTAIEFNTLSYYKPYRDTVSMLYKMKDGDTCFINYTLGVNHVNGLEYFMVVKVGTKYSMVIKNEINEWRTVPLFAYEFPEFAQYGKYEGPVMTNDTQGLGVYYWSLNKQLLRKNCGICLYGFLLRKGLVRGG